MFEGWDVLRPHRLQYELFNCDKRFVIAVAGRQSGKSTVCLRRLVLESLLKQPSIKYPVFAYVAPVFSQCKKVGWQAIKQLLPPNAIRKISETELIIDLKNGGRLVCGSGDAPERLEGL